ncbi:hypothetical protein AAHE18_02G149300 [Arachis hypogaea]
MYSSPPIHGILLVTMILSDPNMKEQWKKEMKTMANRIRAMRTTLCRNLEDLDSSFNWEHITNQVGMFCFSGLAPDQHGRCDTKQCKLFGKCNSSSYKNQ